MSSKSRSCKNLIQSTIHQPLQIRTNKHRCFVFCLGHTSLTCVPGIGKKNKYLLNQSGIYNLSTLYRKYRSIDNIQHFQQWLENHIGFTSYQAKMTACGIGSKLGEIKEINTGLTPICCPSNERRRKEKYINKRNRSIQSKNNEEEIKKRKIENIKLEKLSPNSNRDRIEPTSINTSINKNKLSNNLSDRVKSPDNPIFAVRQDESDLSSSPNQISKTKPMKSDSSLENSSTSEQLKKSQNFDQQKKNEIQAKKSSISHRSILQQSDFTRSPSLDTSIKYTDDNPIEQGSPYKENKSLSYFNLDNFSNDKAHINNRPSHEKANETTKSNSQKNEKIIEIISSTKHKLQPTLDSLHSHYDSDKKVTSDEESSDENDNKNISTIKQSDVSLPSSTSIVSPDNNLTIFNRSGSTSKDKWSESNLNRLNSSQQEILQKEISKAISQIMTQAAYIAHNNIQPLPIKSRRSPSISNSFKQPSTNTTSSNHTKVAPVQQGMNSTSSITHPSGNAINNPTTVFSDQDSNMNNKSDKPSPIDTTQINNDRLQHQQNTLTTKFPTPTEISPRTNKSSESLKIKSSNDKKSLLTLSSLSGSSDQSINRIPSSIDKIQSYTNNMDRFGEETEIKTNPTSTTVFNHLKKEKSDASKMSSSRTNELLSRSQNVKENQVINKNLSEIENSEYQSILSPSTPIPCHALWDSISNEKLLTQRKNHCFTILKKYRSDQKINQNQNYTTLFTYLKRQKYLQKDEALNEHILYIKRIKTVYK